MNYVPSGPDLLPMYSDFVNQLGGFFWNAPTGTAVALILAYDPDRAGPVTFTLRDPSGIFALGNTISSTSVEDTYDRVDLILVHPELLTNANVFLPLTITATDVTGLSSVTDTFIQSHSTIDSPPGPLTLLQPTVDDGAAPGTYVNVVSGTDVDLQFGDSLKISLISDPANLFEFNQGGLVSGALTLQPGKSLQGMAGTNVSVTVAVTDAQGLGHTETLTFGVTTAAPTTRTGALQAVPRAVENAAYFQALYQLPADVAARVRYYGQTSASDLLFGGKDDVLVGNSGDNVLGVTNTPARVDGGNGYDVLVTTGNVVLDGTKISSIEEYQVQAGGSLAFSDAREGVDVFTVYGGLAQVTDGISRDERDGVDFFVSAPVYYSDLGQLAAGPTQVNGTAFSDTLINEAGGAAAFDGGADNDWLYGAGGDTLIGGAGDDVITEIGAPSGILYNNTIDYTGATPAARIDGGDGYDVMVTVGNRTVDAASVTGIEEYHLVAGSSLAFTGQTAGVNVFVVDRDDLTPLDSTVSSTDFSDTLINKSAGTVTLSGGAGNDWLFGNGGPMHSYGIGDQFFGGEGDDVITVNGTPAVVDGGPGTDILVVTQDAVVDANTVTGIEAYQTQGAEIQFLLFDHGVNVAATSDATHDASVTGTAFDDVISLGGTGQTTVNVMKEGGADTIIGFRAGSGGDVLHFGKEFGFNNLQDLMAFAKVADNGLFSIGQGQEFDFDAAHGGGKLTLEGVTPQWLSSYNVSFS